MWGKIEVKDYLPGVEKVIKKYQEKKETNSTGEIQFACVYS